MANVWFFTAADDGASWYRADLPGMALQWRGHNVWVTPQWTPTIAAKADVIVASRPARPRALGLLTETRERYGTRIVADLDDDYWSLEKAGPGSAYDAWHVEDGGALIRGLAAGCELADLVTVASVGEGEAIVEHTSATWHKVYVVPNGLHASILGLPRDYVNGFTNDGVITVGWTGTASSIVGLELCARPLARLVTRHGPEQVRLRLIGYQPAGAGPEARRWINPLLSGDNDADVAYTEWVPHGDTYLAAVGQFDIWVAPYHDNAFNRAKFPTKALEAGFWGIPLVASAIEPYESWLSRTPSRLHPKLISPYVPHQWSQELNELVERPDLRQQYGEAARSAAAPYALQEIGRRWEDVLLG